MLKLYSECFAFHGENICEIPAKCEIRKVYSWPKSVRKIALSDFRDVATCNSDLFTLPLLSHIS